MVENDVVKLLKGMLKRAEEGDLTGLIVYAAAQGRGAHFTAVGKLGLDDFCILAVRAQMCAMESFEYQEERDEAAREQQGRPH